MKEQNMLRCVRKEGKVFFPFGSKGISFVHRKAIYTWKKKVKIYYKVWTNIQSTVRFPITIVFYKDNTNVSKSYAEASAIFEKCFELLTFGIIILHNKVV
jgi:hypothetical protein